MVLDTNVVLDIWLFDDPAARPLRAALECGRLRSVRLQVMIDELAEVLTRPFATRRPVECAAVLKQALAMSAPAPVALLGRGPLRCTDPNDQVFIDLALALPARWLFSHDRALLALARQASTRGVSILRPCDWPRAGAGAGAGLNLMPAA